jgi:hypothetical protein
MNSNINNLLKKNNQLFQQEKKQFLFLSFPRSGSNWACLMLQEMIKIAITNGQLEIPLTKKKGSLIFNIGDLNTDYAKLLENEAFSGIVKSHGEAAWDKNSHIIYMFRNPQDVLASFRNWMKKMEPENPKNQWSDFQFIKYNLNLLLLNWCRAIKFGLSYPSNIIFLEYENMYLQSLFNMKKMAGFLGLKLQDKELNMIFKNYDFSTMQLNHPNLIYRTRNKFKRKNEFSYILILYISILSFIPKKILQYLAFSRKFQ